MTEAVGWPLVILAAVVSMIAVAMVLAVVGRSERTARPWARLAVLSAAAMPLAIVMHNVLSALIQGEEAVSFVFALVVAPVGFAVGTLGAGFALAQRGRWEVGASLSIAGGAMTIFGLCFVFVLVATSIAGDRGYGLVLEVVIVPAVLALAAGAIASAVTVVSTRLVPSPR